MSRFGSAFALLALLVGCSGNVSGTVSLLVIGYQPPPCCLDGGELDAGASTDGGVGTDAGPAQTQPTLDAGFFGWDLVAEDVTTLHNLRTMTGGAAAILHGGTLDGDRTTIEASNPVNQAAFDKTIVTVPSAASDMDYLTASNVIYPVDSLGIAMTTSYYNFEQAQLYFQAIAPSVTPGAVDVRINPTITNPTPNVLSTITDDPFSQPFLHEFVVQTTSSIADEVSPSLQLGVVGHKYAHAIFQAEVFPGTGLPWLETALRQNESGLQEIANLVSSLDEGFADYFGASIASDPNFILTGPNTPDPTRTVAVTTPRCLTATITSNMASQTRAQYSPYPLGSILSAVLWDVASSQQNLIPQLNQSLLASMSAFGTDLQAKQDKETLAGVLNTIASNLPSSLGPYACGEILDRFQMTHDDIPACSISATPEQTCANSQ